MNQTLLLYNLLGKDYLASMYTDNIWTRYVDSLEKDAVLKIWGLKVKQNKAERILDLGMGPGRWSKFFISQGFKKVVGLDISPKMVKVAKKYVSSPKFKSVKGNMENIPFAKKSFDKVFCFRAFKYVLNPKQTIREIDRVLMSKGTAVLEFSNKSLSNMILKFISLAVLKLNPRINTQSRFRYFVRARFYSKEDVFNLINSSGLHVKSYRYFAVLPSVPLPSGLIEFWRRSDAVLFSILPKRLFSRSLVFLISK